jgi:hypothetical protein
LKEYFLMANLTENRPLPKTGAESEFDRGVGATPYKARANQGSKQDNQNLWIVAVIALVIAGGGLYYYMNSGAPSVVTPTITQTTPPPVTTEPEVVTPPAVTPDPSTAPKTNP